MEARAYCNSCKQKPLRSSPLRESHESSLRSTLSLPPPTPTMPFTVELSDPLDDALRSALAAVAVELAERRRRAVEEECPVTPRADLAAAAAAETDLVRAAADAARRGGRADGRGGGGGL